MKYQDESSTDELVAVYLDNNTVWMKNISLDMKFRIWDLMSDCHNELHVDQIFPIGMDISLRGGRGVALYCKNGTDCNQFIAASSTHVEDPSGVDFAFLQDKCISSAQVYDQGDQGFPEDEVIDGHQGLFSCLEACRNEKNFSSLALVNDNWCVCSNFDRVQTSVDVDIQECKPCLDNESFTCGKEDNYFSAYYVDPSYGNNLGYKYWHCVNFPFNFPWFTDSDLMKDIEGVPSASECLVSCKEDNFEIAMVTGIEDDTFECICLRHGFYQFRMQDFSLQCTESGVDQFAWCPDVDGPCVPSSSQDESVFAVYCLDVAKCNESLIMPPRQEDLCILEDTKPDPLSPVNECSRSYYQCNRKSSTPSWEKLTCPDDKVYSDSFKECTPECNTKPKPNGCNSTIGDSCYCSDDVGVIWTAKAGERANQSCQRFSDKLEGAFLIDIA